jgi:pimeloyl-ACP methyl ester carboxylesterase
MSDGPAPVDHWIVLRDGLRMYCREFGSQHRSRPALLCLPGLTRNSRDFEALATSLADRWRVLTPDLRGRGRSDHDPNWQQYQPMTYVADIGELLQQRGESRVVVVGTSLGGLLAMLMAALHPAALAGAVLNDIGPELDPRGLARIASYVGKLPPVSTWDEAAAQSRFVNGAALPDFTDEDWHRFARATYRDDGAGRPVLDMDPRIGDAMREAPAGAAPDLWPLFGMLEHVPVLAIRGETSDILSPETFARMRAIKPDLRTLTVARRGHAPTLDEPESRVAIRGFLESLA